MFMNPRPSQEWYNRLYRDEFWRSKREKSDKGNARKQLFKEAKFAAKIGDLLDAVGFAQSNPNPEILEVGCAFGLIVRLVAERFHGRGWGVEPSDEAKLVAERIVGTPIYARSMDELIANDKRERFDLIIFSHVLENITNAPEALHAAQRLLKADGLILIDTRNNYWFRSWHIHHPYCFTAPSLSKMLARSGLQTIKTRTWSRPKMAYGGLYLSIVAQRRDAIPVWEPLPVMASLHMRFGPSVYRLLTPWVVRYLNSQVAQHRWRLEEGVRRRVAELVNLLPDTPIQS